MDWYLVFVSLLVLWYLYYRFVVCQPVSLFYTPTTLNQHIVALVDNFNKKFSPTLWMFNTHLQTIYNVLCRPDIKVEYYSEVFRFDCGGEILLDWVEDPAAIRQNNPPSDNTVKTVVIFSGVCGGSQEIEIKHFVSSCIRNNHRAVVVNYRGAQTHLRTERFGFTAEDIVPVVSHIRQTCGPHAPLIGVGFSLGSNILVKYLGMVGSATPFICALSISNPYDLNRATKMLRNPVARWTYDHVFTSKRKELIMKHKEIYQQIPGIDFEKLKLVKSTREFDDVISRVILKVESLETLYNDMGCTDMISKIAIPTLFLNALDDPISAQDAIPYQKIKSNPNCILATTERGGHVAWIDGLLPIGPSWMEQTCQQFITVATNLLSS
jgi:predicted alpha/beta-fold hydrolase